MKKNILITLALLAILASCSSPTASSSMTETPSSPSISSSSSGQNIEKTKLAYTFYDYQHNSMYLTPTTPLSGSPKLLVIPVWFTDSGQYIPSDSHKANVREDIGKAFFGSEEETGWESVASFYKEESQGKLSFIGTLSSWYESSYSSLEAGQNEDLSDTIMQEAVEWYFSNNPEEDRKSYDLDEDGYIDAVNLIYAAPDHSALGDSSLSNLWAYRGAYSEAIPNIDTPAGCIYFWASYDFMYGESNALARSGASYHGGATDGFSSSSPVDAHTYIHEFGHALGLSDYYDLNSLYVPAGGFSMEDNNTGGHEAYSVMALGWADPYIPTESCSIEIGAFQSTRDVILLTPSMNDILSPFDEYLLIELYSPTGLNSLDSHHYYEGSAGQGPLETGIRLWHVDARLAEIDEESYEPMDLTNDPRGNGNKVYMAYSNTYYLEGGRNEFASIYGEEYSSYNELQLIRNNKEESHLSTSFLQGDDLFKDGDSFSMKDFSKQFVYGEKLNDQRELGWSFSVSLSGEGENAKATIDLIKE